MMLAKPHQQAQGRAYIDGGRRARAASGGREETMPASIESRVGILSEQVLADFAGALRERTRIGLYESGDCLPA